MTSRSHIDGSYLSLFNLSRVMLIGFHLFYEFSSFTPPPPTFLLATVPPTFLLASTPLLARALRAVIAAVWSANALKESAISLCCLVRLDAKGGGG